MGDNKVIDGIVEKIPQVKEVVEKVEQETGKKIGDIANEVGGKINEAIKEQGEDSPKEVFGNIANKLLGKKD